MLSSRSGSFYYSLKVYYNTEGQEVMLVACLCVYERGRLHRSVSISEFFFSFYVDRLLSAYILDLNVIVCKLY